MRVRGHAHQRLIVRKHTYPLDCFHCWVSLSGILAPAKDGYIHRERPLNLPSASGPPSRRSTEQSLVTIGNADSVHRHAWLTGSAVKSVLASMQATSNSSLILITLSCPVACVSHLWPGATGWSKAWFVHRCSGRTLTLFGRSLPSTEQLESLKVIILNHRVNHMENCFEAGTVSLAVVLSPVHPRFNSPGKFNTWAQAVPHT